MAISTFRDLRVWQKAQELTVLIYGLTNKFPSSEIYGLTSQIRKSAHSVSSNIAEGFGRRGLRDKTQFLYIARGSILETQCHILVAKDLGHVSVSECARIDHEYNGLIAGLNALISNLSINRAPNLHTSKTQNL